VAIGVVTALLMASAAFSAGPESATLEEPVAKPLPRQAYALAARYSRAGVEKQRQAAKERRLWKAKVRRLLAQGPVVKVVRRKPVRTRLLAAARPSEQAVALERLYAGLGPQALYVGLEGMKDELGRRVLEDSRVSIYPGGRSDIAAGRIDVRILALIEYLAEAHGQVSVSCLISGHRRFARPGVVSAHIYGRAVDIAALGGIPILGHQEPGGLTEQAVREILSLPAAILPKQVISLLDLGGPSFPLEDHQDHIHVGY
jgi:hypothetical protein